MNRQEIIKNKADLSDANLSDADLSHANLSRADLSGANLITFCYRRHFAYGHKSKAYKTKSNIIINIGCMNLSLECWLDEYKKIGKRAGYSNAEIEFYYKFILLCKEL